MFLFFWVGSFLLTILLFILLFIIDFDFIDL